jgi:hypothetical protein
VAAEGDRLLDPMISVLPLKGVQIASWKRRNPWTTPFEEIRRRLVGLAFDGLGGALPLPWAFHGRRRGL